MDIKLADLRDAYNCVVLCYGSAKDRTLDVPGENLPNVLSARRFVGWYNGVPEEKQLQINLSSENVVVIGHGNVALDCARILLTPVDTVLKVCLICIKVHIITRSSVENGYYSSRNSSS